MANPLLDIQQYGQSIWYDNIRRSLITSGELKKLVDEDGLMGVTSNPAIFEKAIAFEPDYQYFYRAQAEMLMPGRRTVTIGIPGDPGQPVYERQVILSLLHVQRLERKDTPQAASDGG